jgi:hypothetical protein
METTPRRDRTRMATRQALAAGHELVDEMFRFRCVMRERDALAVRAVQAGIPVKTTARLMGVSDFTVRRAVQAYRLRHPGQDAGQESLAA